MSNCNIDWIKDTAEICERFEVRVNGDSMLPLLGDRRDRIIVRHINESDKILGRIVMCRTAPGHYVVHRVVKIENDMVTMRGDGRLTCDAPTNRENIIGIVEGVIRHNGRTEYCNSRSWRLRERIWLIQPMLLRRCNLAIIRRWRRLTHKENR